MLAVWRAHGVDEVLKQAYENGTFLAGNSTGALCWFEQGTTDSFGSLAPIKNGLGFLRGSYSPHGANPLRIKLHARLVESGVLADGMVQHDDSTLVFRNGELAGCASLVPDAPSFFVKKTEHGVETVPIPESVLPF